MSLHLSTGNPYPSYRSATYARNGMIAASQPQAAQAGRDILAIGGNAIDAAIATAAALTVVEPTGCGIGGDAFALVWIASEGGSGGELHGLNASGAAPKNLTLEAVESAGYKKIPLHGWMPVTVPGAPAAWAELSRRFGKLDFKKVLGPSIKLARDGFPVSPTIATLWQRGYKDFSKYTDDEQFSNWFKTFSSAGEPPKAGEWRCCPDQAYTLEQIANTKAESFYRGEICKIIDRHSKETGGFIRGEDLSDYQPEWVAPIKARYRGYDIWEIPPNGQGMVALMALNIIQGFDQASRHDEKYLHQQIEAMKLAYTDGFQHVTQMDKMAYRVEDLLADSYASERRELITEAAITPAPGKPSPGGTVYLAAADKFGNMVSFIQSNYHGFGSGIVVPGTGISLQNRGHDFSLDREHVNVLQPGKKTFHTIIPGFLSMGGVPLGPFGVMGGFMQPQGHVQVAINLIDHGLNPQASLDSPRWQWLGGKKIAVEHQFPLHLIKALADRGHDVCVDSDTLVFGRGQIIIRDPETGIYCGGCETRTDSNIEVF